MRQSAKKGEIHNLEVVFVQNRLIQNRLEGCVDPAEVRYPQDQHTTRLQPCQMPFYHLLHIGEVVNESQRHHDVELLYWLQRKKIAVLNETVGDSQYFEIAHGCRHARTRVLYSARLKACLLGEEHEPSPGRTADLKDFAGNAAERSFELQGETALERKRHINRARQFAARPVVLPEVSLCQFCSLFLHASMVP